MRSLIAIAVIALLGAAALGYAWRLLGDVPRAQPATPEAQAPASAPADERAGGPEDLQRVAEPVAGERTAAQAPARELAGLEEGGAEPLRRDYAAIYAGRTHAERQAAAERLVGEIAAARAALTAAEQDELAGRSRPSATSPGVARLIALLEERAWLVSTLGAPAGSGG